MVDCGNNENDYNAFENTLIQFNRTYFKFHCVCINVQGMVGIRIMVMECTSW